MTCQPTGILPETDPFHDHDHDACRSAVLHSAERQTRQDGIRLTPVRRRTLEILLEAHRAMGAYEVLERLVQDGFANQPPVAYRALDFLVGHGLAHRIRRLNAYVACHAPDDRGHQPAFLICQDCGRLAEVLSDHLREALRSLAAASDFALERTTIELQGLCSACRTAGVSA